VTAALPIAILGFLSGSEPAAANASSSPALVVVALPVNANPAILEALHRLRGEATSVGFDVHFVSAATETVTPNQLQELGRGLRPAAVVAFSGSQASGEPRHSLDVLFLDRASGKTTIEHIMVGVDEAAEDRGEVIVSVRAVDFIRARMLDALVSRATAPRQPERSAPAAGRASAYLAAGMSVMGAFTGFAPSVAPELDLGYAPQPWLRIGVAAFGFGTRPSADSIAGVVELDQRYLGAGVTALGPAWHGLRGAFELGGGWHWLKVDGTAKRSPYQATSSRSSSAALIGALGVTWSSGSHFLIDLRGGSLWLQNRPQINGLLTESLGSLGRPSWFARVSVGLAY
jgi:hypothetical protein